MRILLVLALLIITLPAQAGHFSGAYLRQLCTLTEEGEEILNRGATACQAYILGIVDYHNLIQSLGTAPSVELCVPDNISPNDLQRVVVSYLNKHYQHDSFNAAPAVALALFKRYPCK